MAKKIFPYLNILEKILNKILFTYIQCFGSELLIQQQQQKRRGKTVVVLHYLIFEQIKKYTPPLPVVSTVP
jgi:hypothetical protein